MTNDTDLRSECNIYSFNVLASNVKSLNHMRAAILLIFANLLLCCKIINNNKWKSADNKEVVSTTENDDGWHDTNDCLRPVLFSS